MLPILLEVLLLCQGISEDCEIIHWLVEWSSDSTQVSEEWGCECAPSQFWIQFMEDLADVPERIELLRACPEAQAFCTSYPLFDPVTYFPIAQSC